MGNGQSNNVNQYVSNNIEFSSTTEVIVRLQNQVGASTIAFQNLTINFGYRGTRTLNVNGATINQNANLNVRLIQDVTAKIDTTNEREIQQAAMTDMQNSLKNMNEFLSLGFLNGYNSNNVNSTIENAFSVALYDRVDKQSINKVFANLTVNQNNTVNFFAEYVNITDFTINQDILYQLAAYQLVYNAFETTMQTYSVQDIINKIVNELKNQQTGAKDLFRGMARVIAELFSGFMPIVIIIGVLMAGAVVFYIYYSNSKKHPKVSAHDVNHALDQDAAAEGPVAPEVQEAQAQAVEAVSATAPPTA